MDSEAALNQILTEFERRTGLSGIDHETKERSTGPVLIIQVANPTDRLFDVLEDTKASYVNGEPADLLLVTLERKAKPNLLKSSEGRLLLRTLSESLNINRTSFKEDFLARYTKSVFGAEERINASANHVVFGRRGAGKSSLLLYAMHTRAQRSLASVWIDMQVYARRSDSGVIIDVLAELIEESRQYISDDKALTRSLESLQALKQETEPDEHSIRTLLPEIKRLFAGHAAKGKDLTIFLDDFHVIGIDLQPKLLGVLYAVARGNSTFLKISAIETLTKTWDSTTRQGLQIPHDAQEIKLDYNLTIPEKATEHIGAILDTHAVYCGLPSTRALCTSQDVLPRLVWVAAGVPRDALNLFSQAITKAALGGSKHVSVTNVNVAASEAVNTKLRDLQADAFGASDELQQLLEEIRDFCVKQEKKNALLVEIRTDNPTHQKVLKLVDLRLLHVISEGISVGEAGRKYLALILDYGFYIGMRAARSVDLFNRQTRKVAYRDLRKLPVFTA